MPCLCTNSSKGDNITVAVEVDHWLPIVVERHRPSDVRQVLWAPHAAEVYVGVVGLTTPDEPAVPVVAPLATRPQCLRLSFAPGPVITPTIVLVAIEVPTAVAWELTRASVCEDALPSAWDLQVEAVLPIHVIADVCDLDDHAFANKVRMRSTIVGVGGDGAGTGAKEGVGCVGGA